MVTRIFWLGVLFCGFWLFGGCHDDLLEQEQNGTKAFKAENDKEYYRQQMDNARTTSNRLSTDK